MALTIGVDIGGTFTDFALLDGGEIRIHKIPSTPSSPAFAVARGISDLTSGASGELTVIHGTTVATNALLENKGAKTAFVATRGFEDIIEIGRQNRAKLYDLFWEKEKPLVPRRLRIGVSERIDADGTVVAALSKSEIIKLVRAVRASGAESVAVCFLHSYANPAHEEAAGRAIEKLGLAVSLSSKISPEFREYERASTTAANACLVPKVRDYMKSLSSSLGAAKVFVIQSSGGVTTPEDIADKPVTMATSGPAAGVMGAFKIAQMTDEAKIITCDMGGTSTDISLCDGSPAFAAESAVGSVPLRGACIDISTAGAGGGSIARINPGGVLKTGPQSAGAEPGPACYGKGSFPTVTDANLVLERIDPNRFLGGRKPIFPQRAARTIKTLEQNSAGIRPTAESVIRVVNSSVERLIRVIAADKGADIREFALFGFGGAAGLHCCELAAQTGMKKVIFPRRPAALSALGMLLADFHKDYAKGCFASPPGGMRILSETFSELEKSARAENLFPGTDFRALKFVDARYRGQSHEITLEFSGDLISDFHKAHLRKFGYAMTDAEIETTAARLRFCAAASSVEIPEIKPHSRPAEFSEKPMWFCGSFRRFRIYERSNLGFGFSFKGPALVFEDSSVLMITPEFECRVDRWGNIIAEKTAPGVC